ncbi:hypothetical protein BDV38DRAFT_287479 [Aspergillus pseudotamarii]|uniref:Zn(2)-C6 fungal-type domain-containing protein n=1 Tax=Aspergillus pseudotamarii TaxID=132259 RepID=A0A5N6SDG5_ASPPS|nr:uncharacterized protein BDV38DRAFT_287479 [Aspergillus pseudotamarii]KAE8132766.1 hypothetical protein BDV38DRAFT_287479 [Aspergillus pseudotamarii]
MPPHVGVIVNPSARRVACDQCHAQKLRCTKLENCTVCIRCQRLNRQCIWSPPSRSGRPAKTTAGETLVRRSNAREKRRKRSLSALEMTPEEDGHPDSAREHVRSSSVSTLAHTDHNNRPQPTLLAVGISEVPPSGPPSITDWNMSDIFSFSSPRDSSRENLLFPSLWTPDSVPPMPNLADYFQLPANGLGGLGTQPRIPDDRSAPSGLDSLQDITRELSNVNLSLFDLEQSLHAEPWGPMFASPTAVITKLSTCSGDQPDDTLAHGYPLIDTFKKTQRFIDMAKQTRVYFASLPTPPPASTSTSSSTGRPSSIGQAPSWRPSHVLHPDSDTSSQGSSPFSPPRDMPPPYSTASSSTTRGDRPGRTEGCDLPTALLFTTGYARILELYMTVLTQMSHFVHALSVQSMAGGPDYRQRMHPVIPPLQWGGFQPTNYGALQILMAIQVISYLLTEVERALGVDEWEYELTRERPRSEESRSYLFTQMHGESRRRDSVVGEGDRAGASRGLISPAMIELVVQGEGPGNRRGKVGLLRRKLRQLKKELEKSMHI